MSYVFGPVPSRRLGRSLGVDMVPFKTCSYDCIYCQLGRTTEKTVACSEYASFEEALQELQAKLATKPDYITLSGSGEPTLFSRLGEFIDRVKTMTDIPVAVLTNGSLLWREDVREQLMHADLVVPSLDAGDEKTWRAVNRPCEGLSFEKMLEGLITFGAQFKGQVWLEIVLLAGYTDSEEAVMKLVECVDHIKPDRVQLNTVTRPPAEDFAAAVPRERMEAFASLFTPRAEVVADFREIHERTEFARSRDEVMDTLRRRPCSVADLAHGLGMHRNEVLKYIEELLAEDLVTESVVEGTTYYLPK